MRLLIKKALCVAAVALLSLSTHSFAETGWAKISLGSKYLRFLTDKSFSDVTLMGEWNFLKTNERVSLAIQAGYAADDITISPGKYKPDFEHFVLYGSLGLKYYSREDGHGWWIGLYPLFRSDFYSSRENYRILRDWDYTPGIDCGYDFAVFQGLGASVFLSLIFFPSEIFPLMPLPDLGLWLTYSF